MNHAFYQQVMMEHTRHFGIMIIPYFTHDTQAEQQFIYHHPSFTHPPEIPPQISQSNRKQYRKNPSEIT
jgi:hypothetical protein